MPEPEISSCGQNDGKAVEFDGKALNQTVRALTIPWPKMSGNLKE